MNYIPILEKHFTPSVYNIEQVDSDGYGRNEDVSIYDIRNKENNKLCITLSILPDENMVHIESLIKCSPKSSREQLGSAEAFAQEIGYHSVSLDDYSKLEFCNRAYRLDLSLLKLLSNGQSWYESVGYTSNENTSNREHNLRVIEKPMEELIEYVTNVLTQNALKHSGAFIILNELKTLVNVKSNDNLATGILSKLTKIIGHNLTTVKNTFTEIAKYLQLNGYKCDDNLLFIYYILSMVSFAIKHGTNKEILVKYSRSLTKHIRKGGRRRKSQKKKRSRKRH